jgi:hypothetical protein
MEMAESAVIRRQAGRERGGARARAMRHLKKMRAWSMHHARERLAG